MSLAPIVIFGYNRPDHLQQALQGLKENILANESSLFILIDGPKSNATAKDLENINAVKKVARSDKWCKEVNIVLSGSNKGLAGSIMYGVTEIVNKFGKVIVMEDDLVSDKYFLKFMNDSLDLYENEKDVVCISGYIYPVKGNLPETFLIKGADCWGWATWKRGWECMDMDAKKMLDELEKKDLTNDFDFDGTYPYTQMLKDRIEGKNNSWAILWYVSAYLKNKLCLYPGTSLIQNIGNDGSGIHSWESHSFKVNLQNREVKLSKLPIEENAVAKKIMAEYFSKNKPVQIEEEKGFIPTVKSILSRFSKKTENSAVQKTDGWFGNYSSWEEVKRSCTGYDEGTIFEKVKNATLEVKKGNAVFERDSVLFHKEEYKEELLNTMDQIAGENKNELNVLDFGGALGSVYFQYRKKFEKYASVNWCVVEQKHFVDFGKKELEDKNLKFYYSIDDCLKGNKIDCVLLSSVISYMEAPYDLLNQVTEKKIKYVIVDRNIFTDDKNDILTKQVVPEFIYNASYPCWVLNKNKLITFMLKEYELVKEFDPYNNEQVDIDGKHAYFSALVFKRK